MTPEHYTLQQLPVVDETENVCNLLSYIGNQIFGW